MTDEGGRKLSIPENGSGFQENGKRAFCEVETNPSLTGPIVDGNGVEVPKKLKAADEFESTCHDGTSKGWENELLQRPVPPHERNYMQYYAVDVGGIAGHDHYIYRHPNGLCIVGMAAGHAALQSDKRISHVDFEMGKRNWQPVEVTGKNKRNAKFLDTVSALCKVVMDDGSHFIIRSCVKGSLLEINYRLATDSTLLSRKAESEGFIAILMPKAADWEKVEKSFLSRKQYFAHRHLS